MGDFLLGFSLVLSGRASSRASLTPTGRRISAVGARLAREGVITPCANLRVAKQPRLARPVLGFKRRNRFMVHQRQTDIVQTVEQAMLTEGVNFKAQHLAIRTGNGLGLQIDLQLITRCHFHLLEQLIHFSVAQDDRQQAVLEAVVEEDVGVARRDDAAETVFLQRPRRMFTTGTATEVFAGQQHAGALITLGVEDEVLVQRALGVVLIRLPDIQVAPLIEQVWAEPRALDRLQELLRDDLVGVDVGTIQRGDKTSV